MQTAMKKEQAKFTKRIQRLIEKIVEFKTFEAQMKFAKDFINEEIDELGLEGVVDLGLFDLEIIEGLDYTTFDTDRFKREHPEMVERYQRMSHRTKHFKLPNFNLGYVLRRLKRED